MYKAKMTPRGRHSRERFTLKGINFSSLLPWSLRSLRKGRDSNSRYRYRYAAFRERCLQPLGHLSFVTSFFCTRKKPSKQVSDLSFCTCFLYNKSILSLKDQVLSEKTDKNKNMATSD